MRFSPDNRTTLETLLSAISGPNPVPGQTVYPMLQDTIAAQEAQNQQRKERMQAYATQVAQLASTGTPMGAATTMMDLLTPKPGVPGNVQGMLDTAYPTQSNYMGQQMDFPEGNRPPAEMQFATEVPTEPGMSQSPLFLNDPSQWSQNPGNIVNPALQQQLAPQPPPEVSASEQQTRDIGELIYAILRQKAQGVPQEQIMEWISTDPYTAGVFAQNWDKVMPFLGEANPLEVAAAQADAAAVAAGTG